MKKQMCDELLKSVHQGGRILCGEMKPARRTEIRDEDIRAIRKKLGVSQMEFALLIGVSVGTLRNWEQGRRRPDGPAQALLRVAAKNPRAVAAALGR